MEKQKKSKSKMVYSKSRKYTPTTSNAEGYAADSERVTDSDFNSVRGSSSVVLVNTPTTTRGFNQCENWLTNQPEAEVDVDTKEELVCQTPDEFFALWTQEEWDGYHASRGIMNFTKVGIEELPAKVLDITPPIKILILRDNKLTHLSEDLFERLEYLSWIDVRNNELWTMPELILPHYHLRVALLDNNDMNCISPSFGLAESLLFVGMAGNPVEEPVKEIRQMGFKAILLYWQSFYQDNPKDNPMFKWNTIRVLPEDHSQKVKKESDIKVKVKSTTNVKSGEPKFLSSLSKHLVKDFKRTPPMKTKKGQDKMKYTFEVWKDVPYNGPERTKLVQNKMKDLRNEATTQFNIEKNKVLQRIKDAETLSKWREKARQMKASGSPVVNKRGPMKAFGPVAYVNCPMYEPVHTKTVSANDFQKEFGECNRKLAELTSLRTSDAAEARRLLQQAEMIRKRISNLKVSLKAPVPQ